MPTACTLIISTKYHWRELANVNNDMDIATAVVLKCYPSVLMTKYYILVTVSKYCYYCVLAANVKVAIFVTTEGVVS